MTAAATPDRTAAAARRWDALRARLRTVTPEAIGRSVLAIVTIAASVWLAVGTWPALLPFLAGALIAYAVLPIANRLDRILPRFLAALVAEAVAIAIIAGVLVLIVPPLLNGLTLIVGQIPTGAALDQRLADLQAQFGSLPEPLRSVVLGVTTEVIDNLSAALQGAVAGLAQFVTSQILGIFETASFLLGLLVIPVWILTVVADERRIKRSAAAAIAPSIRADVYALFRIIDRTLGTFIRVQVLIALVVGVLVWAGLAAADAVGLVSVRYAVAAGAILGVFQVVPQLGFLLGFFPMLLVLAVSGPVPFLITVVIYIVANRMAGTLVNTSVSRGVLDVHPALMIPGLVAIGQLGLLPLLAGAPLIVIAKDTVRYLNGRFSEPPKPANLLPGEKGWEASGGRRRREAPPSATVPAVYRAPSAAAAEAPAASRAAFVPSVYRTPAPATAATPALATATTSSPTTAPVTEWSSRP